MAHESRPTWGFRLQPGEWLPLHEARAELGISPPEPYRPLELDAAFARFAKDTG